MKKTLKKFGLHKSESERTLTQRICRDVACFSVVIVAAVLGYFYWMAEINLAEAECYSAEVAVENFVTFTNGL